MSSEDEKIDISDWTDFEVSSKEESSSAVDLYQSYKLFKNMFDSLPKDELIQRGWITSKNDIASLTDFFKYIHAKKGGALFRKSDTANEALFSLWISKVRSDAEITAITNSIPSFKELSKDDLKSIANLSVDVNVIKRLPSILLKKGIVLIYSRALPSMKLDGVVFKIETGNPVVGMSLRYSRLDNFWFTLMHELAHVHLHIDFLDSPILDDLDTNSDDEIEISANRLATNSLIDRADWRNCAPKYDNSLDAIEKFSKEMKIHKSIVAGMLRKDSGNYKIYTDIVKKINVREVIFGHD